MRGSGVQPLIHLNQNRCLVLTLKDPVRTVKPPTAVAVPGLQLGLSAIQMEML